MKISATMILFFLGILISAQENFVQINGNTNINSFKCINTSFKISNLALNLSNKKLPNLSLKVDDFDCHHKIMTSDFKKTLSADEHPYLNIKFLNVDKNKNIYNTQIEVRMMNKSKIYNIALCMENGKLTGKRTVKFSDFNIKPPKKMGGMVVVKDDLNLIFALDAT